jgi:hypothetical protein
VSAKTDRSLLDDDRAEYEMLDVLTNPEEVALPLKVTPGDAWGLAVAQLKEAMTSQDG